MTKQIKSMSEEFATNSKKLGLLLADLIKTSLITLLAYVFVYNLLLQPTQVNGASMDPTLADGSRVINDIFSYRFYEPQRGDVITLRYPKDPTINFVKRVVGLPDEKLLISNGEIYVFNASQPQGFKIEEDYLSAEEFTHGGVDFPENTRIKIPSEAYFVLGDNRIQSSDSRAWGFVPRENILGHIVLTYWPISSLGLVK